MPATLVKPRLRAGKPHICIRNILLVCNSFPGDQAGLLYATCLGERYGAMIYVGRITPSTQNFSKAATQLERLARFSPLLAGIPHQILFKTGELGDALSAMVQEHAIDLVVLSARESASRKTFLVAPGAEELIRVAPCPVLFVGPDALGGWGSARKISNVLYATDFLFVSGDALDWALAVAEEERASLTLLHTGLPRGEAPVEDADAVLGGSKRNLEQLLAFRGEASSEIEMVAKFGLPAESILDHAAARHSGLIVMGLKAAAHLRSSSHVFWTAIRHVIAQAQCPVLAVHG